MASFEGTVISSIEGKYASLTNQVLLEIKVEYRPLWLSTKLYPILNDVNNLNSNHIVLKINNLFVIYLLVSH